MALNAKKVKGAPKAGAIGQQEPIEPGSYPARLVQVLDLGLQNQRAYKGEEKPPAHEVMLTYELLDEFCKDADGEDIEDKPRWVSETIPLRNLAAELATSTKRYKALDPDEVHDGDFTQLVDTPCTIIIVNNESKGKVYNNVQSVAAMRPKDARNAPALINPPKVLDLSDPDLVVFGSLPDWLQEKIKGNLEFDGSPLQEALEGAKQAGKEEGGAKPQGKAKKPVEVVVEGEEEGDEPW